LGRIGAHRKLGLTHLPALVYLDRPLARLSRQGFKGCLRPKVGLAICLAGRWQNGRVRSPELDPNHHCRAGARRFDRHRIGAVAHVLRQRRARCRPLVDRQPRHGHQLRCERQGHQPRDAERQHHHDLRCRWPGDRSRDDDPLALGLRRLQVVRPSCNIVITAPVSAAMGLYQHPARSSQSAIGQWCRPI